MKKVALGMLFVGIVFASSFSIAQESDSNERKEETCLKQESTQERSMDLKSDKAIGKDQDSRVTDRQEKDSIDNKNKQGNMKNN